MTLAQFQFVENSLLLSEFRFGLFVMEILLFMCSLFLMALVLVQRGKGGGLTGALGGMGGQSAFGSKAGDAFTKITIVTAAIWIFLCMMTIALFNPPPAPTSTLNNEPILSGVGGEELEGDGEADSDAPEKSTSAAGDAASEGNDDAATEGNGDAATEGDDKASDAAGVSGSGEKATDAKPVDSEAEAQPTATDETSETKSDVEEK